MRKFNNRALDLAYCAYRWMKPVIDPVRASRAIPGYVRFCRDWFAYGRLPGAERRALIDSAPELGDATRESPYDRHYFLQDIWAFRKIRLSGTGEHVDVGSRIDLIGFLTVICKVTFIDIRPLVVDLAGLRSVSGSILALPLRDNGVNSLSCLHVAEHIGLGRYGDALDPLGTRKACRELARVLAPGGNLYFSCPIGVPRLCYNAHRIHTGARIMEYFDGLRLVEFSGIDDNRGWHENIGVTDLDGSAYACGLFHFTKE